MNSIRHLHRLPAGRALVSDHILEFHAARLLLLLRVCGTGNRIDGLTKLAKLDFFVRYPRFFAEACRTLGSEPPVANPMADQIESPMVRHHYGPWDKRYYHVLAYLEGTQLLTVAVQPNGSYRFALTNEGAERAQTLTQADVFQPLVVHMRAVKKIFGPKSGDALKKLIYRVFDKEVAQRLFGEVIR